MNERAPKQDLLDIITTALEGGIGYWSKCDPIKRDDDLNYLETRIFIVDDDLDPEDPPAGRQPEHDWQAEADAQYWGEAILWRHVGTITTATIRRALEVIRKGGKEEFGQLAIDVYAADDAGDLDALQADAIVQIGLFGEVIYG